MDSTSKREKKKRWSWASKWKCKKQGQCLKMLAGRHNVTTTLLEFILEEQLNDINRARWESRRRIWMEMKQKIKSRSLFYLQSFMTIESSPSSEEDKHFRYIRTFIPAAFTMDLKDTSEKEKVVIWDFGELTLSSVRFGHGLIRRAPADNKKIFLPPSSTFQPQHPDFPPCHFHVEVEGRRQH